MYFSTTGDFSEAKIDLRQNSLLRLDSSVFRALLEQMTGQAPDKNSAQLLVYKSNDVGNLRYVCIGI